MPISWKDWLKIFLMTVIAPALDVLQHELAKGELPDWKHILAAASGGLSAGFLGWLLPQLGTPSTAKGTLQSLIVALLIGGGILAWSRAEGADLETRTSTAAEPALSEALGIGTKEGFGLALHVVGPVLRFSGLIEQGLAFGGAIGVDYKTDRWKRFPLAFGAALASELKAGASSSAGFALLLDAILWKGFGLGLGWEFYDGAWKPLHAPHCFAALLYAPLNSNF